MLGGVPGQRVRKPEDEALARAVDDALTAQTIVRELSDEAAEGHCAAAYHDAHRDQLRRDGRHGEAAEYEAALAAEAERAARAAAEDGEDVLGSLFHTTDWHPGGRYFNVPAPAAEPEPPATQPPLYDPVPLGTPGTLLPSFR